VTITDWFVLAAVSAWLLATVLNQLSFKWAQVLTARDPLRILPRWTFFAPRPGTTDYAIIYRDIHDDGSAGQFVELTYHQRTVFSTIFNPHKRTRKTMNDLASSLGRLQASGRWDGATIVASLPYVALLNYLSATPAQGRRIQFCLVATRGRDDSALPEIVLASAVHYV
jgi:hypothetical protein